MERSSLGFLGRFAAGVSAPFLALKILVTRPRLWPATLIPWLVSGALTWLLVSQAAALSAAALAGLGASLGLPATGWLGQLLGWAFTAITWIVGALMLTWLSALVALPFADWLAELSEPYCEPPLAPATQLSGWFSRAHLRRFKIDFFKTLAGMALSLAGLVVSALPVLGILGAGVLALGLAFQFMSYPQTRRDMGVTASIGYLLREFSACLGFGLVLMGGFAIPFFSAFLFPLAVIGGTLLFGRLEGRGKAKAPGL